MVDSGVKSQMENWTRPVKDVKTTMIYTRILGNSGGRGVTSPADTLKNQP